MVKLLVVERKISIQKEKNTPKFGTWVISDIEYLMGEKKGMMKTMTGHNFDQGQTTIVFYLFLLSVV